MNPQNSSTIPFTLLECPQRRPNVLLQLFPETEVRTSVPSTSMNQNAGTSVPSTSNNIQRSGTIVSSISNNAGSQVVNGAGGRSQKSSKYKGVSLYRRTGRWEANIWAPSRTDGPSQVYLGASHTEIQAARAYDRALIHFKPLTLDFEVFNFNRRDYAGEEQQLIAMSTQDLVTMLRNQSRGDGIPEPGHPEPGPASAPGQPFPRPQP